jgi:hydroxyacylglutathione hydrolase
MSMLRILPIPCLQDNYAYLLLHESTGNAVIVDASEAAPVARAVDLAKAKLTAVWSTHHHLDHVGGNEEIAARYKVDVYGHASDRGRIPAQTRFVATGEKVAFDDMAVETMHIPGHTLGAIAYIVRPKGEPPAVFTGDTLFIAGCGRLFEGTPAQMHQSLVQLTTLPTETRVYCGHEYTENNLRFAAHVEPSNADVTRASERGKALRAKGEPTMGWTLAEEAKHNPFLRTQSPEIRATLGVAPGADDATAFAAIRKAKDSFR